MRICSNCGASVQDGAKFCSNCATPVPAEKATLAPADATPTEPVEENPAASVEETAKAPVTETAAPPMPAPVPVPTAAAPAKQKGNIVKGILIGSAAVLGLGAVATAVGLGVFLLGGSKNDKVYYYKDGEISISTLGKNRRIMN